MISNNRNAAIIRVALLHDDCETLNGFLDNQYGVQIKGRYVIDDVRYCYATKKQHYIFTAPSGDVGQYSRNWILATSIADVAVIRFNVHQGLYPQMRFNCYFAAILGIRHIILVVDGINNTDANVKQYETAVEGFYAVAKEMGFATSHVIKSSVPKKSDAVQDAATASVDERATLIDVLDTLDLFNSNQCSTLSMAVHYRNQRRSSDCRIYGKIITGTLHKDDLLELLPAKIQTRAVTICDGSHETAAVTGGAISVVLQGDMDINCGDVLATGGHALGVADQFEANLVWLSERALVPGRQFQMILSNREASAAVTGIKYHMDMTSSAHLATRKLNQGEIARVNLYTNEPLAFEHNGRLRSLNGFLLIDKMSGELAGAGMIDFALRRATNIKWQALTIDKATRAVQKSQTPQCIWFTGLSGSGKSTIANQLEKQFHQNGCHTYLLDGDNVRHGLCRDLGFTEADRVENIRRVSEVAKLMVDAGLIVLVSFISPFRSERRLARELFAAGEFVEVFVDTDLEECERRDIKGLYAKARNGMLKNFTGIDSPYEPPEAPEIHIQTASMTPQQAVEQILKQLKAINH